MAYKQQELENESPLKEYLLYSKMTSGDVDL